MDHGSTKKRERERRGFKSQLTAQERRICLGLQALNDYIIEGIDIILPVSRGFRDN